MKTWGIFRTPWITRIKFTINSQLSVTLQFKTLEADSEPYQISIMERFVQKFVWYLDPFHIHNLRNIRNPVKHLWCSIFLRTLCNPGIFRILVYSEPEEYSEPCQASIMQRFLNENTGVFTMWHIYDGVFYLEPSVTMTYLDSWYIQNLRIFSTQDIKDTVNL